VAILESEGYRDFDPLTKPDSLTRAVYKSVYGEFLANARTLLGVPEIEVDDEL
jgi:hypothetical protein